MSSLYFRELRIRRMPGFRSGGFVVDDLCPGINLVWGPNASGKTTTSRALEALLWPRGADSDASLWGRWEAQGEQWTCDLDAGRVLYQRGGEDSAAPELPAREGRHRYLLSLHELLRDDDADFAEVILRESWGGYDVNAAAEELGFRPSVSQPRRELAALDGAREALQDVRAREAELREDERRLRDLRQLRDEAGEAARRVELLHCTIAHAQACAEAGAAAEALCAFPAGIALLSGEEPARLARVREQHGDVGQQVQAARHARESAERALASLPHEGVPDSLLSTLRARLQELQRLDGTILVRERELRSARARLEQEKRLLGDAVREDRLPELGHEALDGLAEFARRAEALRGERAAVEAQVRRLGPPASADAGEDLERIREQVRLLQRWLRTPGAAGADVAWLRSLVAAGAGLLLAAGFAGGALLSPLVVGLAVGGMLLLLAAWSRSRTRPAPRAAVQREHVAAGLEPPPRWTEREVEARLAALYRQQAEAVLAGERTGRREELEQSLHAIRARAAELDSERIEIAARVGVAPEVDEAKLFWLVERVSRWQAAASDVDAAAVELQAATAQRTRFLERASSDLLPLGAGRVEDAAELHGRIEALAGVRQQHAAAMAAREAAVEREATAVHRLEELQAGVREVFERLGLEPDDDATLDEWCRQREPYLEAENRVRAAEHERARTERALRQRPDFEPGLVKMALDDLERERTEREWTAGELPSLQEEIIRIETRLHDARSACDVEAAITHHGACLAALGEVREKDYARTVGAALADFLQQETRDRERPRVFHRARELFALITRGRYRLEVGHGDGAAFRALDTTTHVGYALEELSSATRVQLLFAVRVAFVETQEHGPRLPLLLDETLGNSDDQRAQAIIEAVLALCREGRQVFYFTAQPDEVGKWRAALEAHPEVPYRVVDLARARELRGTELPPLLLETSPPAPQVPTPDGAGYVEYGRRLGVPAFDPCIEDTSRIHLWHLLDCPDTLHRLLSLNVERWGQLRTLWEHGGGALLGDDAALYGRMDATARLLGEIARAWRVGRGRPVDRRALIDSGAITETFLERVCGLCAEVGGDGERLLAGLEAGEVARFRSDNIARLREYLETHGFVDREAPLTPEDIRVRALAAAAPDIEDGRLTPGDVERLLMKLPPHLQIRRAHPMRFA